MEKALKEPHCEAFPKELAVMRMARQAYYKTHQPNFEQEGLDDLSNMFQQMATSANLLGTEIHEVQENWGGRSNLQVAKSSSKDIHFFRIITPNKLPKIMALEGIHSPKALQWQSGLAFCLWCVKESQNIGIVVNHLWTTHYHLGLICVHCLDYFTTSTDTM